MTHAWLDPDLYPFEHHTLTLDAGRIHYVDEGEGEPIVFVHGTPTWSFLWRDLVLDLRDEYRCIALDHLGFGLSDEPADDSYTPADHARRLRSFIERLGLRDVTLVVHDFGGPIGLSYAVERPANVKRLVLMNTWLWSNEGNRPAEVASRVLGGPVGRFLYTRLNFSPRVLLPQGFADKSKLSSEVHRHYLAPFGAPGRRRAPWVLARELTGSNDWYDATWNRRNVLNDKPMLVVWGMADQLIGPEQLVRWREAFPRAEFVPLDGVGHFVPEEAPKRAREAIRAFLRGAGASTGGGA